MCKHILDEPTAGALTIQNMLEEEGLQIIYERVRILMRKQILCLFILEEPLLKKEKISLFQVPMN